MKKIFLLLPAFIFILLTGCLDIIQETTINEKGSGVFEHTMDMSTLIATMKMMIPQEQLTQMESNSVDSIFSLKRIADSITGLTDVEKAIINRGSARIVSKIKDDKLAIGISLPFHNLKEYALVHDIVDKVRFDFATKAIPMNATSAGMSGPDAEEGKAALEAMDIDNVYDLEVEDDKIKSKLNDDKLSKLTSAQAFGKLKEMTQMGGAINYKTVYKLPRAVKEIEGNNIEVSPDKKMVTITRTLEDFIEKPSSLEYTIKY